MKKLALVTLAFLFVYFGYAQNTTYIVFEFMKVDNTQENAYREVEGFWKKIHEQRVKNGDIVGWDLWELRPGGEDQGYQYLTVNVYNDPIKMMSGGGFADALAAAYPDMAEEELNKRFNYTANSRDLAVRYYMEVIDGTEDQFEIKPGVITTIDLMKAASGKSSEYANAELTLFKPLHQQIVDAGNKGSWSLARVMNPTGSDAYCSHMTFNMYENWQQFFKESDRPEMAEDQLEKIQEALSLRDLRYTYIAELIDQVR